MESRPHRYLWRLLPVFTGLLALLLSAAVAAAQDASIDITVDTPTSGQAVVDGQQMTVGGWAVDTDASAGTGIDMVHIYADGPAGGGGVILGAADYGVMRPDVANVTGEPGWVYSGFNFNTQLSTGPHMIYVYAHSAADNQWSYSTVNLNVVAAAPAQAPAASAAPDVRYNDDRATSSLGGTNNCTPGYAYDGTQCVFTGNSSSCNYGTYRADSPCTANYGGCAAGYAFNGSQCYWAGGMTTNGTCPAGYAVLNGGCSFVGMNNTCGGVGYYFNGTSCVYSSIAAGCGSSYVFNGTQCVYAGTNANYACPSGYSFQNSGCVYTAGTSCGAGFFFNGVQCAYVGSTTGSCAAGFFMQNGACIGYGNTTAYCGPYVNPYRTNYC